jgi:Chitin binding Peritrophin-A domain
MIKVVLYLNFAFLSFAAGNKFFEFAEVQEAIENPCAGIAGPYFVTNYRGCAWYTVCFNNQVAREDRCPEGLRFNYSSQICDFRDNVECDLDDRWNQLNCPVGQDQGIAIIPHPYVCSKYTGKVKVYREEEGSDWSLNIIEKLRNVPLFSGKSLIVI